ncbi:MAG: NrfD/PsrC family molybdoenzyme membrane anchor subunit [Alphaproteobacteria bacterium]
MFELPTDALINYIFPNNAHVFWSLTIVVYPYITGLMAGAFVVSALAHVFKVEALKPIGNFALIAAFCFGAFAGAPLLLHLGQPQRFYEIYLTPHLTSAMSIFGYVWGGYMVLLLIEIWLIYRKFFIQKANEVTGLMGRVWTVLCLGITTYHPDSRAIDKKLSVTLAGIGIPWAILLHGYVGFIFGSVKAIAWWATPLQPVIFILSAMVSGMALLVLMYTFITWRAGGAYDYRMLKVFITFVWGVFLLAFTMEMLEVATVIYEKGHHWELIGPLLSGPLFNSWAIGQVLILSVVPAVLLGVVARSFDGKKLLLWANIGSFMLVLQVLFMRFNVVIGGQLISKSERGFVEFQWEWLTHEGVIPVTIIFLGPFIMYYVISRFIPIFDDPATVASEPKETL